MNPNDRCPNPVRDFIGGLFLVPLLHLAFAIVWLPLGYLLTLTIPFFQTGYNFFLLAYPLFFLGVTQILYLIPTHQFFARKQRWEVCKGIISSAVITLLVNGACSIQMGGADPQFLQIFGVMVAIATAIGLLINWLIARRNR